MAPPNHDTFYVLSPVPNLLGKIDWEKEKESYREKIETYLENTVLPGLKKSIVTSKVFTPNDFEQRYLAFNGAAFGMEPLLLQSAWFRPHNKSEDIKGLYMVGASTHPGRAFLESNSAKLLDKVIPESFAEGTVVEKKPENKLMEVRNMNQMQKAHKPLNCSQIMAAGSKSFYAASRLFPHD